MISNILEEYDPYKIQPQIFSIVVVFLILLFCSLFYFFKLKKQRPDRAPHGFVLVIQMYIEYIRDLTVSILGYKHEKLTPYFIVLFSYLLVSNTIGIIGISNPTSSLTVTLSMGLVTWIGMFVFGFKYQKISYVKKFCFKIAIKNKDIPIMVNPLEIIGQITPVVSISFRLWGNIFAGSVILGLWYAFCNQIFQHVPLLGVFNLLGCITSPPIHIYFDLLCGVIQALVFTLLTMVYWNLEKGEK